MFISMYNVLQDTTISKDSITDITESRKMILAALTALLVVSFLPAKLLHFNLWNTLSESAEYLKTISSYSLLSGSALNDWKPPFQSF